MSTEDNLKKFKQEICSNCKNNDCEHGIVIINYQNELQMKCCDYISNGQKNNCVNTEVIKYFKERGKRDES